MRLVIIESPFAGDVEANVEYARRCVRDSLLRGEAPIASHLLYTQPGILDDNVSTERQHGIDAGLAWRRVAQASVVYIDRGISSGMEYGIAAAMEAGLPVEFRAMDGACCSRCGCTGIHACIGHRPAPWTDEERGRLSAALEEIVGGRGT